MELCNGSRTTCLTPDLARIAYGVALLEIGVERLTVGGLIRKSSGIARNTKNDKKVLGHIFGQTLFERPASSYAAMSSNAVEGAGL